VRSRGRGNSKYVALYGRSRGCVHSPLAKYLNENTCHLTAHEEFLIVGACQRRGNRLTTTVAKESDLRDRCGNEEIQVVVKP